MTRTVHTHDDVSDTLDRLTLASLWREAAEGPPPQAARFQRLVVATDGSDAARRAFDWATTIARAEGAHVHIISAVAPPPYAFDERISDYTAPAAGSLVHYQALMREEEQAARRLVDELQAELRDAHIECTTQVQLGFPAKLITEAAASQRADLIVLGAHQHGLLGHLFVSDTTDTVRRRAPCHVLVANGPAEFERILVPVDGSDASRRAAYTGHDLARRLHKDELLLHVFPRPMFADADRAHVLYDEALAKWAKEQGTEATHDTPLPGKVRYGTSVREIVAEASEAPSLIVMGSRGLTGAKARLLGSVSHAVVHEAPLAVLLVQEPQPTTRDDSHEPQANRNLK